MLYDNIRAHDDEHNDVRDKHNHNFNYFCALDEHSASHDCVFNNGTDRQ